MYDPYYSISGCQPNINYVLGTPALILPVSLVELKQQARLRAADTSEDDFLTNLISIATNHGEKFTRREFINKTWIAYLNNFPTYADQGILIRRSKLQSITSIQYYSGGVLTTVASDTYYKTDDADFGSIELYEDKSWPGDVDNRKQAVKITFVAGYGLTAADVPSQLREGVLQHATAMYQARGDAGDAGYDVPLPSTAILCYGNYKIFTA